jgi:AI-2 transport protein TqsA
LAPRTLLGLQIAALVVLLGWALHATASVSALIVAAIFVAIVMSPIHRWVVDRTGRRWIGHAAAFLVMIATLSIFAGALFFAAQRIATEFPALAQVSGMVPGTGAETSAPDGTAPAAGPSASGDGEDGGVLSGLDVAGDRIATRIADLVSGFALTGLEYVTTALGALALVVFLALLLLVDAPRWRARMAHVFGDDRASQIGDAAAVTSRQVGRFLLVRAGLGLVTAALYMLWLWPFGVGLLFVWGVLTFLLSFVPNVGSIVSGILPTIYAFLTKDFGTALGVAAGLLAIEQVIGNYVDPRVQGREVSISPSVILAALLLFSWIWGVPGALLSTPVLIASVIAFARMEDLRPAALLLSNARSYGELDEAVRR